MRRLLLGLAAVTALVLTTSAPAAAHTDTGEFTATRAEPNGSGGYTIDVLLVYTNDGHGAEDATVTVTAQGATGPPLPVTMAAGDRAGAYTGDVVLDPPGEYTITVSSSDPEAETTFSVTAVAPTTTTAPPTTTTAPAPATSIASVPADGEDADDSGGRGPWWVFAALAGLGVVIGLLLVRHRNARDVDDAGAA